MPPLVLFGSIFSPKSLNLPQGETSMAPGLDSRYTVPEKLGNSFVLFSEYIFTEGTVSNLNPKSLTGRVRRLIHGSWTGFGKTGTLHAPACYFFWIYFSQSQCVGTMLNLNPTWFARRLAAGWDIDPWLLDWTVKNPRCTFFPCLLNLWDLHIAKQNTFTCWKKPRTKTLPESWKKVK